LYYNPLVTCFKLIIHHLYVVHSNERPFPCHWCTQTFKSSSNRSKHERRIHEAERKASKLASAIAASAENDTAEEEDNKLAEQIAKPQSTSTSSSTRNISKSIVPPPPLTIKKEKDEPAVFRCEYEGCTSSFRTRSSLKDHQKVHSDER
jgi:hypothetical protein